MGRYIPCSYDMVGHVHFLLQLIYEFCKSCEADVAMTMTNNWQSVCGALLSDDNEELSCQMRALQIVEKNIYHRCFSSPLLL